MAKETASASVVMALSELVALEQDRIESDRAREAQRALEARAESERALAATREAERERLERAEREARVAEAEARLRVEADRERDQRIAAMRAELARVEAQRLQFRAELEARSAAPAPTRTSGWALAFGLSSLVAASLAGLLVMQQGAQAPSVVAAPAPTVAAAPVIATPAAPVEVRVAVAPQAEAPRAAAPVASPRGGHRPRPSRDVETATQSHSSDLVGLGEDDDSDDVLGDLASDAHRSLHH